jgi:hypothetical protein
LWIRNKFLYIVVGIKGRLNEALVFSKCTFREAPEKNILNLPSEGYLWLMMLSPSEVIL